MKKTFTLFLVLATLSSHAQIKRIQLTAGVNHTYIPSVKSEPRLVSNPVPSSGYSSYNFSAGLKERFEGSVGFHVGGTADYYLGNNFFITSGLTVNYLRFKRSVSINAPQHDYKITTQFSETPVAPGQPFGVIVGQPNPMAVIAQPVSFTSANAGQTSVWQLQMPVLAGTSLLNKKLLLRGGTTVSWVFASSVYKARYTVTEGISENKDVSNKDFSSLLLALTVDASYLITRNLSINAGISQYLTPIYTTDARVGGEARYRLSSLGISYLISR